MCINWKFKDILYHPDVGEGNGNPLQYSRLENPMNREAGWDIVHGVVKSQTWLSTHITLYVKLYVLNNFVLTEFIIQLLYTLKTINTLQIVIITIKKFYWNALLHKMMGFILKDYFLYPKMYIIYHYSESSASILFLFLSKHWKTLFS